MMARRKRCVRRGYGPALIALTAALSAGCGPPDREPIHPAAAPRSAPTATVRRFAAGRSVEGRPIECVLLGDGHDVVLLLASIHGDEGAGTPLLRRLVEHLRAHPRALVGRTVVILPAANPDGMAAGRRTNVRGVDLNRNFPTTNRINTPRFGRTALSEPEARTIHAVIVRFEPARMVTIHQPLGCVDYDGPAAGLATRIAEACGLPVRKLGARPGSLGSWAGVDRRIPIVTLELPADAGSAGVEAAWRRYSEALLAAVSYPPKDQRVSP